MQFFQFPDPDLIKIRELRITIIIDYLYTILEEILWMRSEQSYGHKRSQKECVKGYNLQNCLQTHGFNDHRTYRIVGLLKDKCR